MIGPGPTQAEIEEMVRIAGRTPDHGKLAPWRFVHIPGESRADFAALLHRALLAFNAEPSRLDLEATARFAFQAPELIVALSCPVVPHKIPLWEQELSCGASCMNLMLAAHAMGYVAGWITGWPASSDIVRDALGADGEKIAGFIYIGRPGTPLEERPRPVLDQIFSRWRPQSSLTD